MRTKASHVASLLQNPNYLGFFIICKDYYVNIPKKHFYVRHNHHPESIAV